MIAMKVEYLPDASPHGPFIRLYDFTSEEAACLQEACHALHIGRIERFDLHAQPWVTNVGGFRLSLGIADWNRGLVEQRDGSFAWLLKQTWWDNVEGLIEPLVQNPTGWAQWIDSNGGTDLLLSYDGTW